MNEDRDWNRFYAEGSPIDIDLPTGSLSDLLEERVAQYSGNDAIAFFGKTVSYRELGDRVARVAEGLRTLGVQRGDRVALVMPNAPQHVIAFYACTRATNLRCSFATTALKSSSPGTRSRPSFSRCPQRSVSEPLWPSISPLRCR